MRFRKIERRKVKIGSSIILYDVTSDELTAIKNALTFQNPAHANALKFSRYSYTNIPQFLMYYNVIKKESNMDVEVPIGFDFVPIISNRVQVEDNRVYEQISHSPFVLDLRKTQEEAAEAYLSRKDDVPLSSIVQLPTGKGKSILGLYIASQLHCKTLIVVHKDDLVNGWKKDIELAFDGKVVPGIIKAKKREVGHFLTIATVQTLNRLSGEELKKLYDTFGLVIQDEMHHCPASSYEVVSHFNSRYKLGLTATPERADGLDHIMHLYYGDFCYRYKNDEEEKDILPVKVIRRISNVYFNPLFQNVGTSSKAIYKLVDLYAPEDVTMKEGYIRLSDIPYDKRPSLNYQNVDNFVVTSTEYSDIVCEDIISEYDKGHSCLVFFTQKEHCRLYYDILKQSVSEDHLGLYYGDNSDNQSVLEKAENIRKFITLTTYAKATEGTNVRQWEVEFLVSSINSEKNAEQAAGRIRRIKDGKINPVLIYDYRVPKVYSLSGHGRTRDRRYSKLGFIDSVSRSSSSSIFNVGY